MSKSAKQVLEDIVKKVIGNKEVAKTLESLDEIEKTLKSGEVLANDEKPFRLPYSSPPKASNRNWK